MAVVVVGLSFSLYEVNIYIEDGKYEKGDYIARAPLIRLLLGKISYSYYIALTKLENLS